MSPSPSKNKHKNVGTVFLSEPNEVILFREFTLFQGEVTCISVYTNMYLLNKKFAAVFLWNTLRNFSEK